MYSDSSFYRVRSSFLVVCALVLFIQSAYAKTKVRTKYKFKLNYDVRLVMIVKKITNEKMIIEKCNPPAPYICQINGKEALGVSFTKPNDFVERLEAFVDGRKYILDSSSMYWPMWSNMKSNYLSRFNVIRFGRLTIVKAIFSDRHDKYFVEWQLFKGKSVRTVSSQDEGLVNYYLKRFKTNNSDKRKSNKR